jgi:hypothetical protein
MTLSELIEKCGNDNVKLQLLSKSMTGITANKKGVSKVTFETTEITPNEIVFGNEPVCLIVWISRDAYNKAVA